VAANAPGWRDLAAEVARQWLTPLVPDLDGIRRLIVLPSPSLAALPVEVLVAALPEGFSRPVVSYAPSGSLFARLSRPRSQKSPAPREASSAPTKPIGVRPYAHPYYWASFILIGDPN
jgi:hypothetical protein